VSDGQSGARLESSADAVALVSAARGLAPRAGALAAQIESERTLPAALVDELRDAGLLTMCLPRSLGGEEAEPETMIEALDELARGDASTAWCAMIASTSCIHAAYVPAETAVQIYGGGRPPVCAGVVAPRGVAIPRDGGYEVSGRWPFTSGVQHSDWVLGGCVVHGPDGPELLEGGAPDLRLMLMARADIEVIDTWSVSGLRGTGSHDMVVESLRVPVERSAAIMSERPVQDGRLYAFPLFGLLAIGIAAVTLGTARGAIDDLIELAAGKTPFGSARSLAQRATVQSSVARAEAALRAARELMLTEARRAFAAAAEAEDRAISVERRLGLRLAATNATRSAADVVDAMYDLGGGSSIYDSSPLQRRFRDVHTATQHMMVAPPTYELAGRLLLGLPTDAAQL
jgi:alkylation response protein AidB-like acyl-CoA dehydrogenase